MKKYLFLLSLVFILLVLPLASALTPISACGDLDSAGETYTLTQNLLGETSSCFNISADNIILNLMGYKIQGDGDNSDYGIYSGSHESHQDGNSNLTIMNGSIENFGSGLGFYNADHIFINNIFVNYSSQYGYQGFTASDSIIRDSIIIGIGGSSGYGLYSYLSDNVSYINNTVSNYGIGLLYNGGSTNCYMINNTAFNNYYSGGMLLENNNNVIQGNNFSYNGRSGIELSGNNNYEHIIKDNIVNYNGLTAYGSAGLRIIDSAYDNIFMNNNFTGNKLSIYDNSINNNYLIYNNSYGEIKWYNKKVLDVSNDLIFPSENISIGNNTAYVNTTALGGLNIPANITLNSINLNLAEGYQILRDGDWCSDDICTRYTNLDANPVIFGVNGFSNYTIGSACANITEAGTYELIQDIYSSSTCINIFSNDVILDMKGYTLTDNDLGTNYGININGYNHTTIKNGFIVDFGDGIHILNSNENNITNISITSFNSYGIYISASNNNSFFNVITNEGGEGIYLLDSNYNNFNNVESNGNIVSGINLLTSSYNIFNNVLVQLNNFMGLFGDGIKLDSDSDNNILNNVTSYSNGVNGIFVKSSNNTFLNLNTTSNPTNYNYVFGSNNKLIFNNSYGSIKINGVDFDITNDLSLDGNYISISQNSAFINSSYYTQLQNNDAVITLVNVGANALPVVFRDGTRCVGCVLSSFNGAGNTIFTVPGWSEYSIELGNALIEEGYSWTYYLIGMFLAIGLLITIFSLFNLGKDMLSGEVESGKLIKNMIVVVIAVILVTVLIGIIFNIVSY